MKMVRGSWRRLNVINVCADWIDNKPGHAWNLPAQFRFSHHHQVDHPKSLLPLVVGF